ncbi:MAG: hypothetical protein Q7J16_06215 [Candidatus Cloacimonadales bacterium]|nr:hypothetical protein [Candidatus Cloacimonadales bacterium]
MLDVIFAHPFDLQVAKIIESDSIKEIKYYFPPDQLKYDFETILKDDTGLFVRGEFDLGNEPFRLPETAVT